MKTKRPMNGVLDREAEAQDIRAALPLMSEDGAAAISEMLSDAERTARKRGHDKIQRDDIVTGSRHFLCHEVVTDFPKFGAYLGLALTIFSAVALVLVLSTGAYHSFEEMREGIAIPVVGIIVFGLVAWAAYTVHKQTEGRFKA